MKYFSDYEIQMLLTLKGAGAHMDEVNEDVETVPVLHQSRRLHSGNERRHNSFKKKKQRVERAKRLGVPVDILTEREVGKLSSGEWLWPLIHEETQYKRGKGRKERFLPQKALNDAIDEMAWFSLMRAKELEAEAKKAEMLFAEEAIAALTLEIADEEAEVRRLNDVLDQIYADYAAKAHRLSNIYRNIAAAKSKLNELKTFVDGEEV